MLDRSLAILAGRDPFHQASFSLANRVLRQLWQCIYVCLFRPSPRFLHGWRIFLLRTFGARIGKGCRVYSRARIWAPWHLQMEDYAKIADDVECYAVANVHLGAQAVVSQGAFLCTASHDYNSPNFQLIASAITIKSHAWVAARAFIGPGVTIGEGAVVGACAVVSKDVPAWQVCVGNPARVVKERKI